MADYLANRCPTGANGFIIKVDCAGSALPDATRVFRAS